MNRGKFFFIILIFIYSCDSIQFTYQDRLDLYNPIYNKTSVNIAGAQIAGVYKKTMKYFGNTEELKYKLFINIKENKIKKSVQKNQAISKLDYELIFSYDLFNVENNCIVYEKDITSRFTYTPKSLGHNFASDKSLEKKYELAIENNFNEFTESSSNADITKCLYEG